MISNSSPHRILICGLGIPHRSRGASTVVYYQYMNAIKKEGHKVLQVLLLDSSGSQEDDVKRYVGAMEGGDFQVLAFHVDGFLETRSLTPRLNKSILAEAIDAAKAFEPDLVVSLDLIPRWVTRELGDAKVLIWLGDLRFRTEWLNAWYDVLEGGWRWYRLPKSWIRSRRWRSVYREQLAGADSVIVSSDSSVRELERMGIHSQYFPYPWPDLAEAHGPIELAHDQPPTFLFFGSLVGLGSRSAIRMLANRIYPRLHDLWGTGGFSVKICGVRGLPFWAESSMEGKPEFEFMGYVEDLAALMISCHAVLVPIPVPVGNRSRIVTAMACGATIVAHENTSLGNPDLVNEGNCLLAGAPGQFVSAMRRVVQDRALRRRLGEQAKRCYQDRFHPDVASDVILREIRKILKSGDRNGIHSSESI